MFLARFFRKTDPAPSFSPDLPDRERDQLIRELTDCTNRQGGSMKNARRAQALADLFDKLSPAGKQVFTDAIDGLNDTALKSLGDRYTQIEEAELFGGSESKLAVVDMFETPRQRVLSRLSETGNGHDLLARLMTLTAPETKTDIENILNNNR